MALKVSFLPIKGKSRETNRLDNIDTCIVYFNVRQEQRSAQPEPPGPRTGDPNRPGAGPCPLAQVAAAGRQDESLATYRKVLSDDTVIPQHREAAEQAIKAMTEKTRDSWTVFLII